MDKEQDRARLKKTGDLAAEAATISVEEYNRRKEAQEKQAAANKASEDGNKATTGGTTGPTRPPMPSNALKDYQLHNHLVNEQYTRQQAQQGQSGSGLDALGQLGTRRRHVVSGLRSQSCAEVGSRRQGEMDPLPIDKLPSKIKDIVVRLDEDINKISTYIQQVQLEPDQLTRYVLFGVF